MDWTSQLSRFSGDAIGRVSVRSALNVCLWLYALSSPFGLALLLRGNGLLLQIVGIALIFGPMLLFVTGFLYFMVKNPDKLRSEDYELRKTALTLIEQKGGPIAVSATSIEAISNPDYESHPKPTGPGDAK